MRIVKHLYGGVGGGSIDHGWREEQTIFFVFFFRSIGECQWVLARGGGYARTIFYFFSCLSCSSFVCRFLFEGRGESRICRLMIIWMWSLLVGFLVHVEFLRDFEYVSYFLDIGIL